MTRLGIDTARSEIATSVEQAMAAGARIGLPLVIRPAYTMGGTGGACATQRGGRSPSASSRTSTRWACTPAVEEWEAVPVSGVESIMVNCNPETVSTDYDTPDRLYFEPVTGEDVLAIYEKEKPDGAMVQFGGQTPLNIARQLEEPGVRIIGTSPETIDLAEDRERFSALVTKLVIKAAEAEGVRSLQEHHASIRSAAAPRREGPAADSRGGSLFMPRRAVSGIRTPASTGAGPDPHPCCTRLPKRHAAPTCAISSAG